jgi:hypothetical protein
MCVCMQGVVTISGLLDGHPEQVSLHFVVKPPEPTIPPTRTSPNAAYVSIRQHTSAYVSIRQHTSAYVSIRQHFQPVPPLLPGTLTALPSPASLAHSPALLSPAGWTKSKKKNPIVYLLLSIVLCAFLCRWYRVGSVLVYGMYHIYMYII